MFGWPLGRGPASAKDHTKVKATANAIVAWIKARSDRVVFNDAPSFGSIGPEFKTGAEGCLPLRLWTDGSLPVCFNQLKRMSAFAADSARQELVDKLNTIPGVAIPPDALEKQPYLRLEPTNHPIHDLKKARAMVDAHGGQSFLVDPQRDCYGSSGEVKRLAADIDDAIDNQVGILSKLDRIGSAACSRLFAASVSAA